MPAIRDASWISLSKLDTSFVFASTHSLSIFDRWGWIERCVRDEFDCYADDTVDLIEDDDGRDLIAINGDPVVQIHHTRLTGSVAGLPMREAA
jgi:hypothetical protein